METDKTIASIGEFELISRLFSSIQETEGPSAFEVGVGDDAAVVAVPRTQHLHVTTDTLIEGIHFNSDMDPYLLGRKSLLVNLSDLAAMGATPHWFLLSLSLPPTTRLAWGEEFARGLDETAKAYGLSLIGGDTVGSKGCTAITITLMGIAGEGRAVLRSGARAGDLIFVSGTIGDSALGLGQLLGHVKITDPDDLFTLRRRHQLPEPRVELGVALQDAAAIHAAIDLSDGLVADLGHICQASGLAARIDAERIPLSDAARRVIENQHLDFGRFVLAGGEDYELLFCADPGARQLVQEVADRVGVPIAEIGALSAGDPEVTVLRDGLPLPLKRIGWTHF